VIITCPQCQTQYRYDEARFGAAERKKVKCPKCERVFEVENPSPDTADSTRIGAKGEAAIDDAAAQEPESAELPELAPIPKDLRVSLAVIAGAQAGSVFTVTKPRVFLGRGSSMDIQLKDAEVSRKHAMLEIRGDVATLVDMGTTNGTFMDGERIDREEISNQSEFTLGTTTLMLIVTHTDEAGM
jgi:predicted Zn finger-like uncharacterized protein